MKVFFVPGRKWTLSLAELTAVIASRKIRNVPLSHDETVFLYDVLLSELELKELFHSLGGFTKCGIVVDDPLSFLEQRFKTSDHVSKRVCFSVSFMKGLGQSTGSDRERERLGIELKKWLSSKQIRSRFVSKRGSAETSPVLISTNNVLETGFELNRLAHPKTRTPVWGVTTALQNYEAFATRDYGRPNVNKKKGMIPPKLARIMVNLAQLHGQTPTIWDPFCGSGTILMEALVLGYSVVGTDIDTVAIQETQDNLRWLCDKYWISHTKYTVFRHDIADGMPQDLAFDGIVTEPYLGPILRKKLSCEQVEMLTEEIRPLYTALDRIARKVHRNTVRHPLVLVIPGFNSHSGWIDMAMDLPEDSPIIDETSDLSADPLQWDRPNSIIRRNIKVYSF